MFNENRDEENLILVRGNSQIMILNAFPYNNGHMMIVPYRHTSSLEGWSSEERNELMEMSDLAISLLKQTLRPDGFNLGINMGQVAGAGIVDHIHIHVVPRWNGDTNFMPVLANTRVISEHLKATYKKLVNNLDEMQKFKDKSSSLAH
jgi:ATP adenylyltransferase